MRRGRVFYNDIFAGILTEIEDGEFIFQYDANYVMNHPDDFLTFTMPVTSLSYRSNRLFPFFEGLIPEGWLLDIATENWKIDPNDKMGLLLACCQNCIGAVSVTPVVDPDEK
jgi:serine/threonine-protein kinase HipA